MSTLDRFIAQVQQTIVGAPRESSKPQPFNVTCVCGGEVHGERGRGVYQWRCPSCQQLVFALPRNTRPPPAGYRAPPMAEATLIETLEAAPMGSAAPLAAPAPMLASAPAVSPAGASFESAAGSQSSEVVEVAEDWEARIPRRRRRLFTPLRLVALVAIALVGGTGYISWNNMRRAEYQRVLEKATEEGLAALKANDFSDASDQLAKAAAAARGLGEAKPAERLAVQLDIEAQAWRSLIDTPLEEFFMNRDPGDDLTSEFERKFVGKAAVFDVTLRLAVDGEAPLLDNPPPAIEPENDSPDDAPPEEDAEGEPPSPPKISPRGTLACDWRFASDDTQATLTLPSSSALREWCAKGPRRAIVCGFFSRLEKGDRPGQWKIVLHEQRTTFITIREPLVFFGWPDDPELEDLVAEQRKSLGLEP